MLVLDLLFGVTRLYLMFAADAHVIIVYKRVHKVQVCLVKSGIAHSFALRRGSGFSSVLCKLLISCYFNSLLLPQLTHRKLRSVPRKDCSIYCEENDY